MYPTKKKNRFARRLVTGASVLCLGLVLSGCVSEPSALTGSKQAYGYTWQQELQLGAESDQQIMDEMGVYPDDDLQKYVDTVARRVLEKSDFREPDAPEIYRDTKFTFRVLDSPVVNAFALPGGYVYVTRGLLAHLNNEAQLSVVLGHEIGHVIARHASRQALRAQIGQLGLLAGAVIGEQILPDQNVGSQILELGSGAFQLFLFRYGRDAEREADDLGVKYASRSGYAAAEGAEFFRTLERISEASGKRLPAWQSTHPDPGERAKTVRELGTAAATAGATPPEVGTDSLLTHLDDLVLGDDPRQGFRTGDTFFHPELRMQFSIPAGWKMQNERAAVLLGEPNGAALIGMQLVEAGSVREAATKATQEAGTTAISVEETKIAGLPAAILIADTTTQNGTVRTYAAYIEHEKHIFNFIGQATAANFPRFQSTFHATAHSFAPVQDPRVLEMQPARLRVVTVDRNTTFQTLVPTPLPSGITAEQLAIINQVELNTPVERGRKLKLPR